MMIPLSVLFSFYWIAILVYLVHVLALEDGWNLYNNCFLYVWIFNLSINNISTMQNIFSDSFKANYFDMVWHIFIFRLMFHENFNMSLFIFKVYYYCIFSYFLEYYWKIIFFYKINILKYIFLILERTERIEGTESASGFCLMLKWH